MHRLAAAAMVAFAAVGAGIQILNQLNQYTALTVATDPAYTHALGTSGADGLAACTGDLDRLSTPGFARRLQY